MDKKLPSQPVQIPWANSQLGEVKKPIEANYVKEVAEGKTLSIVASTKYFRIVLPYTTSSFLASCHYIWERQKFETVADAGGHTYVVLYTNFEYSPDYLTAVIFVIGDAIYIQDENKTTRILGQFVNDFIIEDDEKIYPNQEVLKIIKQDVKTRGTPYLKQIQNESDQSVLISIAKQNPLEAKDIILNNYSLVSETLQEFVEVAKKAKDYPLLSLILEHHNSDDSVFLSAISDNDPYAYLCVARSSQASPRILYEVALLLKNINNEPILSNLVESLLSNFHAESDTVEYIFNHYRDKISKEVFNKLLMHRNLPPMLLKQYVDDPEIKDVARKQMIRRMFSTK